MDNQQTPIASSTAVNPNNAVDQALVHEMDQPPPFDAARDTQTPINVYAPNQQNLLFAGYENNPANWDGYHHFHADGLHIIPPVIYNDNQSLVYHSGYGYNSAHYSPVATPMPSMMVDNTLYPFTPNYYTQPALSNLHHASSAVPVSPTDLVTTENATTDNMYFGPGSAYYFPYGSYGGANLPLDSGYNQSSGILGPYEHSVGQMLQQQQTYFGHGSVSSSTGGVISRSGSYQFSDFGSSSSSYPGGINDRRQFFVDKGQRRDKDQTDSHNFSNDRNRGPRASRLNGMSIHEQGCSSDDKSNNTPASGIPIDLYNRPDFFTDYEEAKFFIIKSFNEDNVHKSIKYNVWASTPHGNRKLDASHREAQEKVGRFPVFLFFSVNGSGQFCGVAEMVGPVDFEKDADYWQMDRWNGQFPVKWHIIKDVPNSRFRHILLENNDNKPVTHSRDSQEVKLEHGIEMLKIFKDHDCRASILDDFDYYDERERLLKERKAKQQGAAASTSDASNALVEQSVKRVSESFAQSLRLEDGNKVATDAETSNSLSNAPVSLANDSTSQSFESFSQTLQLKE